MVGRRTPQIKHRGLCQAFTHAAPFLMWNSCTQAVRVRTAKEAALGGQELLICLCKQLGKDEMGQGFRFPNLPQFSHQNRR